MTPNERFEACRRDVHKRCAERSGSTSKHAWRSEGVPERDRPEAIRPDVPPGAPERQGKWVLVSRGNDFALVARKLARVA